MAKASDKFKPVSKEELAVLVERQIKTSSVYYDSKLSDERQNVLDYYQGTKPTPSHAGNSKYVSMDVFDAVESLKAVLLETFSAGNNIVSFDPQTANDVDAMKIATAYADYVVHRQNDSYSIFSQLIHDGLIARVGIVKVYWEDCDEEVVETFNDIPIEQADLLAEQPDVVSIEIEHDEETGLCEGTLTRKVDRSQVKIVNIPPEEFLITSTASSIEDAEFVAHRTRKTKSDLKEAGYDPKKIAEISGEGSDDSLNMDPEKITRFQDIGASLLSDEDSELQEASEGVLVHECYLYLDMKGTGVTKLWKVTMAGSVILDKEEVDKKPFLHFCPTPVPHAFYGSNYAARVIPTQNARTVLTRGILDHTVITNNPRMMVVKGALTNPKELLENRIGGLVNVTRPDGLIPLPQPGLNPFVFQTLQLLDEEKEEVTGVSKLSQGLNKDALSKQNSQGMVEGLVSLSQQREKIMARNFANQFIKPLYLEVYRLVIQNEKQQKVLRVAGNFVPVSVEEWTEEVTCTVELHLGAASQAEDATKYMKAHQAFSQDPKMARMYTEQNAFALQSKVLEKLGIKDAQLFLTDPKTLPAPQPDPIKMKELQLEERKVAVQEAVAQTSSTKVTGHISIEQMQAQLDQLKLQLEKTIKDRELDIKEYEVTSKAAIAVEEMAQAKEMAAADPASAKAIVSPN
jgi:hypothetical protein